MLNTFTRNRLVGCWFAVIAVIIAVVVAMGVNVDVGTTALLLTLSLVPPGIIVMLWRGAPSPTVAEILHGANTSKDGRP